MKLWCKLFGHKFREWQRTGPWMRVRVCGRCGLSESVWESAPPKPVDPGPDDE